jgi:hypothetical protein
MADRGRGALILVAETDGPTMFVRIGVMRAINRHKPGEFARSTKPRLQTDNGHRRDASDDRRSTISLARNHPLRL